MVKTIEVPKLFRMMNKIRRDEVWLLTEQSAVEQYMRTLKEAVRKGQCRKIDV